MRSWILAAGRCQFKNACCKPVLTWAATLAFRAFAGVFELGCDMQATLDQRWESQFAFMLALPGTSALDAPKPCSCTQVQTAKPVHKPAYSNTECHVSPGARVAFRTHVSRTRFKAQLSPKLHSYQQEQPPPEGRSYYEARPEVDVPYGLKHANT